MGLKLVTAPAEEPVSLALAKAHLRVTASEEDALIQSLIIAARDQAETFTRRRFITQTWDLVLDCFPWWRLELPNAPLQSVSSITYIDTAGGSQTLDAAKYLVDAKTDPGRLEPAYGEVWPTTRLQMNAVTVRFVCGYGLAAAVPQPIKHAMLLLIGHLYQNREAIVVGELPQELPLGVQSLLAPYRAVRF